jgi:site-specific DNA-methyltransferase (adenine-specific)
MIPALLTERAALFTGRSEDARKVIPKVDLILDDPPYTGRTHDNHGKEKRGDGAKERGELVFPPLTLEQIAFYAAEYVALSRGWILVFTDDRGIDPWGNAIEKAGGRWVRTGAWIKTNPMPQMSGDRPSGNGAEWIVIGHAYPPGEGRMSWRGGGRSAIWRGPREPDRPELGLGSDAHPTQKPRWLIQELLGLFAEPGAVVLDPHMGSGTTGVCALATERFPGSQSMLTTKRRKGEPPPAAPETAPMPDGFSFVGIDGDPAHVATAVSRIRPILDTIDLGNEIASLLVG